MTSAAATEIEKRKGSVPITVAKKPLYITIDFIVMHVVMIEHLIVTRPLMEKIVRGIFLDGFHFFDSSTKDSLPEAHLGTAARLLRFMVYRSRRLCAGVRSQSRPQCGLENIE